MLVIMRTVEDPTDPIGKLVCSKHSIRLYNFSLAVNPLGLYGVKPRTLLGKKAAYDPHSAAAPFDFLVMFSEPSSHLAAYVPACVVPEEDQHFLASSFELLTAPPEKLSRYRAHGPPIHEPQPRLSVEFGQVESVAGDGLGLGVVSLATDRCMRRRGFPSSEQLLKVGKATVLHQHSSQKPTAQSGLACATLISRSRRLFFVRTEDRER
jgi:hypothetical protein